MKKGEEKTKKTKQDDSWKEDYCDWSMKERQARMIDKLQGYIIQQATKFKGQAEWEDLIQAGNLAICEATYNYNPKTAQPTTYFSKYIKGNMRALADCNRTQSQYYNTEGRKLRKTWEQHCDYMESIDRTFKRVDFMDAADEKLANITNMSIKSIKEIKRQERNSLASLEAVGDVIPDEFNCSPEAILMKNEQTRIISEVIENLDPISKVIARKTWLEDKQLSTKALTRYVNEHKEEAGVRYTVDIYDIEYKKNQILCLLYDAIMKGDSNVSIYGELLTPIPEEEHEEVFLTLDDLWEGCEGDISDFVNA